MPVDRHELQRQEYLHALNSYSLPYYAMAYMLHSANAAVAADAHAGKDPVTAAIHHDYLWHITHGVASRMRTPMSDQLVTGQELVYKIVPGLARLSLLELGTEAFSRISAQRPDYSSGELGGHALTVNLLMADAHAELYETGYDPNRLDAVMLGRI